MFLGIVGKYNILQCPLVSLFGYNFLWTAFNYWYFLYTYFYYFSIISQDYWVGNILLITTLYIINQYVVPAYHINRCNVGADIRMILVSAYVGSGLVLTFNRRFFSFNHGPREARWIQNETRHVRDPKRAVRGWKESSRFRSVLG